MKEVRYFFVPDASSVGELPADEAIHAARVLRLQPGDELFLMDGCGVFYHARATLVTQKKLCYEILETLPQQPAWHGKVWLAIAPTKMMERMEWLAEKATEVGFDHLTFLQCQFSERKDVKASRIDKIVVSAVKQSRKAWKPQVDELTAFKTFIDALPADTHCFIAHCYNEIERRDFFSCMEDLSPSANVCIMIGPEGDFSINEVRYALSRGCQSVSLGNSRLRTETAGLMGIAMAHLCKRIER